MEQPSATEDSRNIPTITHNSESYVSKKHLLSPPLPSNEQQNIGKAAAFKGITPLAFLGLYTTINIIVYSDRSFFSVKYCVFSQIDNSILQGFRSFNSEQSQVFVDSSWTS
jgi:hypothetical protein